MSWIAAIDQREKAAALGQQIRMVPGRGLPQRMAPLPRGRGLPVQLDHRGLATKWARLCRTLKSAQAALEEWVDHIEEGIPTRRGRAEAAEIVGGLEGQIESMTSQLEVLQGELEKAGCTTDIEKCTVYCDRESITARGIPFRWPYWTMRQMQPALGPIR